MKSEYSNLQPSCWAQLNMLQLNFKARESWERKHSLVAPGTGSWCLAGLDGSVCVLLNCAVMYTAHLQLCKNRLNIWLFSGSKAPSYYSTVKLHFKRPGQLSIDHCYNITYCGLDNNLDCAVRAEVILCWDQLPQAMKHLNLGACGWEHTHQSPSPGLCSEARALSCCWPRMEILIPGAQRGSGYAATARTGDLKYGHGFGDSVGVPCIAQFWIFILCMPSI